MARYIDAELIKYGTYEYAPYQKIDIATKDSIDRIPTADVTEVKHGHWVEKPHIYGKAFCSVCDYELTDNNTPYCANCGAKMDEEAE